MKVSGIVLSILILSGFCGPRCGATVYHSNGTAESVQSIHNNQARNGDTITLPVGTFVWTTGVTITKGITLQGQTTTDSTNGTAVDNTIIQDSDARRRPGGYPFITVNSRAGKTYRITGLTFDGGGATIMNYNGAIVLNGNSHSVRVDHMNWRANVRRENNDYLVAGSVCGVGDHIVIKNPCESYAIYNGDTWPDGTGSNGDGAFAAPTNFGSADFWFVEDNYIAPPQDMTNPTSGPDDLKGARWVWRHNHMYNSQVQSHGTEDGRWHGGRAREVYENDFHFHRAGVGGVGGIRSGVTVFHDNTVDGQWPGDSMYQMQEYRYFFKWPACPFGGATGDNPWDVNDPHGLYGSGTATGGSSTTIVDTTKNWTTNQWAGFTAKFTGNNQVALIQSNTSNTLTVGFYTDSGGGHVWQAGDAYQMHKALIAMDQPGRGQGDLITGNPPINSRTGRASWPNQALEPSYSWNNIFTPTGRHVNLTVGTGGGGGVGGANAQLVAGRDYFNDTPMPGYTPYIYPHPLVSSAVGSSTEPAPTDFNNDRKPDFVLYNASTLQTVIWYMDNNVHVTGSYGPTLPAGWSIVSVADFNRDGHPDYLLLNSTTLQTVIWYLSGVTHIASNHGPTLPTGWELVATADFNGDGYPDLVLYNASTQQTVIWYMHNNIHVSGRHGPTLPAGWSLVAVADFNGSGHPDYLLFNPITGDSVIWYLSGTTHTSGRYGPTVPAGFNLVGVADFNRDGKPDYVLLNPSTDQTAIWYMNNHDLIGTAFGPALSAGWSLVAP